MHHSVHERESEGRMQMVVNGPSLSGPTAEGHVYIHGRGQQIPRRYEHIATIVLYIDTLVERVGATGFATGRTALHMTSEPLVVAVAMLHIHGLRRLR